MTKGSAPRRIRQAVTRHEGDAHLYATFGVHWRAGVAAMIPFGLLYFTTQPFGQAMQTLTTGGYTIGPAVIAFFATLWALMSMLLLHWLRFNAKVTVHYLVYAIGGAVGLLALAMVSLVIVQYIQFHTYDFWNAEAFAGFLWASPLLGAVSSVIGRRTLASGISWHIWIDRKPLPDALTYVEGKHDRDEFQRM